ncbi:MAG: DUF1573 domain-containing protein [Ferruginibacter sp.]
MKNVCFVIGFSILALSVQAQKNNDNITKTNLSKVTTSTTIAPTDTSKALEILMVNEEVHDFGKIPQGKPVTYDFVVTNSGKTPIKINTVHASCGCTTPTWNQESEIAPGATDKINVGYNAQAEGSFNKVVTITYNDSQTKTLKIIGDVWKTPASSAPENEGIGEIKN